MEKQVKVVVSKKEPQNKHVLWLEQDSLHEVSPKLYNNGEWQNLKTVNVPEELLNKVGELNDSVKEFDREVENFNSDITSFRNSLITETQQRMAVDSSLGNRITSVTTTANNNKTSLNTLETKLNTNLANLRAKDTELETAINNEAKTRRNEVDSLQTSISNVGKRVSTTESKIISLQGDVLTLQSEVTNVKNDVVPKAVAEGIAQVVANAPEDLDTLKEVAEYIASDKTNADKIITDISNLKVKDSTHDTEIATLKQNDTQLTNSVNANAANIAKNASDIIANTEALTKQAEELETKAPKEGYAPDLKVDFAKELVGRGVAEPQEIGNIRPTGVISIGDGNATIEKVKGKSVVWNQIVSVSKMGIYNASYITITKGDTYVRVKAKKEGVYGDNSAVRLSYAPILNIGDAIICITRFSSTNQDLTPEIEYASGGNIELKKYKDAYSVIYRAISHTGTCLLETKGLKKVDDEWEFRDTIICNLTNMFGASNEPNTIEEFYARKPLGIDEYAYNKGEIVSYDGANELKSVGFNAFNGTYAKVIGGKQYHTLGNITSIGFTKEMGGETTEVVLNDEGRFTPEENGYVYAEGKDVCIHLTHTYTPDHVTEYQEDILKLPNIKAIKDNDGNQLFPYGLLSAGSAHDEITATKAVKRIDKRAFAEGDKEDATVLTDGKNTLYALATPIEVDLPEPLNLTYDAWDFGTEELIAEGKTTPLNADIVYQFNAVDRIRENTAKNQVLEAELAELKVQLTQLTQVTNDENSNTQ